MSQKEQVARAHCQLALPCKLSRCPAHGSALHRFSISRSAAAAEGRDPRSTAAESRDRPTAAIDDGRRYAMPWRLCDLPKHLPPSTITVTDSAPFPHFGPVFLGTGAAAMSGRFSATPPPRKRSSRPSLSLYLDFPLMSPLTLAACDHFPLSRPPLQVRVRAWRTASAAAETTTTTTTTTAEVGVDVGVCVCVRRRRQRARVSGTHGILCLRTSSRLMVGPRLCLCVSFDPTPLSSSSSVLSFRSVVRSRFGSRGRGQSVLLCCVRLCCGAQATAARSALFGFGVCGCGVF